MTRDHNAILVSRHNLPIPAMVISFIVLEFGAGTSQPISNDTVAS